MRRFHDLQAHSGYRRARDTPCYPPKRRAWVFLFRSSSRSCDFKLEKSSLSVGDDSDQVLGTIRPSLSGDLTASIAVNGLGYVRSPLSVERSLGGSFLVEDFAEAKEGSATAVWRPTIREFDEILICWSNISFKQFRTFLPRLAPLASAGGSPARESDSFVVCDGPGIDYRIKLTAYRRLLSDEDRARFSISYAGAE